FALVGIAAGGVLASVGCAQVLGLGDFTQGAGGSSDGGGGAAPQPCDIDADCSDGLFCNGVEHCDQNHQCKAGVPPCPPPGDPVHCQTACTEGSSDVICGNATAKDVDGDKHGDALCAAAPGDDCNDAEKTQFPGNPEICDGQDNDCDGNVDNGLPLTG